MTAACQRHCRQVIVVHVSFVLKKFSVNVKQSRIRFSVTLYSGGDRFLNSSCICDVLCCVKKSITKIDSHAAHALFRPACGRDQFCTICNRDVIEIFTTYR